MKNDSDILTDIETILLNTEIHALSQLAMIREIVYLWSLGIKHKLKKDCQLGLLDHTFKKKTI